MCFCQVLNVGLLVGALFHILELGSLLVEGGIQARPGTAAAVSGRRRLNLTSSSSC